MVVDCQGALPVSPSLPDSTYRQAAAYGNGQSVASALRLTGFRACLKQAELLAGKGRGREQVGAELDRALVQTETLGGELESPPDHPGIGPVAPHALAPFRIVELAAPRRAHERQHAGGAVGAVRLEPLGEEIADLERQAEQH